MAGPHDTAARGEGGETITPEQSRAARGLLGWSPADLAQRSGLDKHFVTRFESAVSDPAAGQVQALRSTLMQAGIEFTQADPGEGVRLRDRGGGEGTHLQDLTTENYR